MSSPPGGLSLEKNENKYKFYYNIADDKVNKIINIIESILNYDPDTFQEWFMSEEILTLEYYERLEIRRQYHKYHIDLRKNRNTLTMDDVKRIIYLYNSNSISNENLAMDKTYLTGQFLYLNYQFKYEPVTVPVFDLSTDRDDLHKKQLLNLFCIAHLIHSVRLNGDRDNDYKDRSLFQMHNDGVFDNDSHIYPMCWYSPQGWFFKIKNSLLKNSIQATDFYERNSEGKKVEKYYRVECESSTFLKDLHNWILQRIRKSKSLPLEIAKAMDNPQVFDEKQMIEYEKKEKESLQIEKENLKKQQNDLEEKINSSKKQLYKYDVIQEKHKNNLEKEEENKLYEQLHPLYNQKWQLEELERKLKEKEELQNKIDEQEKLLIELNNMNSENLLVNGISALLKLTLSSSSTL